MSQPKLNKNQISPSNNRQTGWSYVTIASSGTTGSMSVTFPTPFLTLPKVNLTPYGYKTGTAPTALSDFTGSYGGGGSIPFMYIVAISTTGFTVNMGTPGGTFGVSYNGFAWAAEA